MDTLKEEEPVANPIWNYNEHGSDWRLKYPSCALSHQSPINLLKPMTKYGQLYDIFPSTVDKLNRVYYDLENTMVYLDKSKYSLNVYIDHNNGYAGFES